MTAPTARRPYDEAGLQQITAEILRNNGITVPPVPVHRILKKLGVHFQSVEFVDPTHQKRLIAFTKREGEQFTISTNAELSVEEQQFGVAREFGRYCLQKETIRTFACTYMDNLLLPEKTSSARELTLFADYLLVPDQMLYKFPNGDAEFIQKTFFVPQAVARRRPAWTAS
jgi:Zn-dependent peptidase ImmA (M78 family)